MIFMNKQIEIKDFGRKYQNLCRVPYHNNKKGCPNFGKRPDCPPCETVDKRFDLSKPMYVIYTEYPVGEFAERMRINHPEWSEHPRQWYNCIRWQGQARKQHREDIEKFKKEHPDLYVDTNPEALGVNVTDIMKQVGISLEWNYYEEHRKDRKTYRVSIAGTLKN
jgi:predicted metal-binding protein